jgi:very-short-patch-repair endonuclease
LPPRNLRRYVKPEIKAFAKELRKNQTPAEQILWEQLRSKRLLGLKFRRQVILRGYIVDFYCPAKRLAIELDGLHHTSKRDGVRTRRIRKLSIDVIRFSNEAVRNELPQVLHAIACKCHMPCFPQIHNTHHHHQSNSNSLRGTAVESSSPGGKVEKRVKSLKFLVQRGAKDCGWFEDSVEICGKQVFADLEVAEATVRMLEKFAVTALIDKKCRICSKIHVGVLR